MYGVKIWVVKLLQEVVFHPQFVKNLKKIDSVHIIINLYKNVDLIKH